MRTLSRIRRFALAGTSLLIAACTFRGEVSAALITRGDDQLRFGDRGVAIRYYERALQIAPNNGTAADRLAFTMAIQRDRRSLERAISVSTAALATDSANPNLLADRAFAEMRLGRSHAAALDFATAGATGHDARYASFAARLARKAGDRELAVREAREAVLDNPAFAPAVLERTKASAP